jgi:DNA uptake protein ComE-like DNA-binding protein
MGNFTSQIINDALSELRRASINFDVSAIDAIAKKSMRLLGIEYDSKEIQTLCRTFFEEDFFAGCELDKGLKNELNSLLVFSLITEQSLRDVSEQIQAALLGIDLTKIFPVFWEEREYWQEQMTCPHMWDLKLLDDPSGLVSGAPELTTLSVDARTVIARSRVIRKKKAFTLRDLSEYSSISEVQMVGVVNELTSARFASIATTETIIQQLTVKDMQKLFPEIELKGAKSSMITKVIETLGEEQVRIRLARSMNSLPEFTVGLDFGTDTNWFTSFCDLIAHWVTMRKYSLRHYFEASGTSVTFQVFKTDDCSLCAKFPKSISAITEFPPFHYGCRCSAYESYDGEEEFSSEQVTFKFIDFDRPTHLDGRSLRETELVQAINSLDVGLLGKISSSNSKYSVVASTILALRDIHSVRPDSALSLAKIYEDFTVSGEDPNLRNYIFGWPVFIEIGGTELVAPLSQDLIALITSQRLDELGFTHESVVLGYAGGLQPRTLALVKRLVAGDLHGGTQEQLLEILGISQALSYSEDPNENDASQSDIGNGPELFEPQYPRHDSLSPEPSIKGSEVTDSTYNQLIDVNTATIGQLTQVLGITADSADEIIQFRISRSFRTVEEFATVSKLTTTELNRILPFIIIGTVQQPKSKGRVLDI